MSWAPVLAVGVACAATLLALAGGYGYYPDELYSRVAGDHLAWGYADRPPLVPLLAKAQVLLFGDTLVALRVVPALLAGASVVLAGLIARELGGGRAAQALAACAATASLATPAAGHLLHPMAVDHTAWVAVCWLLLRRLRTGDRRLWLAIGAVVGVGALAEYLIVLLVVGLAAGLLLGGPRRALADRHVAAGAGVAVLLALPPLIWRAANDWPRLGVLAELSGPPEPNAAVTALVGQALVIGPLLTPVWVIGLVGLLFGGDWRPYRSVPLGFLVVLVVLVVVGGYPRYAAGLLVVLLAAGSVVVARWARTGPRRALVVLAVVGNAGFAALVVLPLAPIEAYADDPALGGLGAGQFEQHGWPEVADQVAAVFHALPAEERASAVVYGGDYAEAGAIDRYGPERGLPRAYSAHKSYAYFGTPTDDKTVVIAFGVDATAFGAHFARCEPRGTVTSTLPQPVQGEEVLVCHDPREPWARIWPELRRLDAF